MILNEKHDLITYLQLKGSLVFHAFNQQHPLQTLHFKSFQHLFENGVKLVFSNDLECYILGKNCDNWTKNAQNNMLTKKDTKVELSENSCFFHSSKYKIILVIDAAKDVLWKFDFAQTNPKWESFNNPDHVLKFAHFVEIYGNMKHI